MARFLTHTLPHIHIILITLLMSVAFNCVAQSSLFLSPRKCGFYKHLTVESGFKRLLTSSGMSTPLWSLSCGSRGMQHMSCLDFRAARRDTVHTSCPCPHPGEHTPITSKEFERVKRVKREREICAQCEKKRIPRNLKNKRKSMERRRENGPLLRLYAKSL